MLLFADRIGPRLRLRCPSGVLPLNLSKRLRDVLGILHRAVISELKERDLPHSESGFQVVPDERGCGSQRVHRALPLPLVQHAHVNSGLTEIGRDINFGDAHETDTRILHFLADNVGELLLEQLTNLTCSSCHGSLQLSHGPLVAGERRHWSSGPGDFLPVEELYLVTDTYVVEPIEAKATFVPGRNLADIVLEPLE